MEQRAVMVSIAPPADLLVVNDDQPRSVGAHGWTAEIRGSGLDDVCLEGRLVLRSIRFIVRDHNWGTIRSTVTAVQPNADGSILRIHGRSGADLDLATWQLTIQFGPGQLSVDVEATIVSAFERNRLGLVVLHSPDVAGLPLSVTHACGPQTVTTFPLEISPHQPALDICGLEWSSGGVNSRLHFGGEVFEMEDQRNWTDASFKTYSTPLSRPFPVLVSPGEIIAQSVRVDSAVANSPGSGHTAACMSPVATFGDADATGWPMPAIASSASTTKTQLHSSARGTPGYLLAEIDPAWPNWRAAVRRAIADAAERSIDLRIVAACTADITAVLDEVCAAGGSLTRVGVFDRVSHLSEPELLTALRGALTARALSVEILGGTRAHFTELNRTHERIAEFDGPITLSVTPFMHDRSGYQLVESIAMFRLVAADALRIAAGRAVHIGPITLGARFNAVATQPLEAEAFEAEARTTLSSGYGPELVPGATDERQSADSLGAWVLAGADALAVEGVASLSWFEERGPRGLSDVHGASTSAGIVCVWLAEATGHRRLPLKPPMPGVHSILVDEGRDFVVLFGNITAYSVLVDLDEMLENSALCGTARSAERTSCTIEWATGQGSSAPLSLGAPFELASGAAVRLRLPQR